MNGGTMILLTVVVMGVLVGLAVFVVMRTSRDLDKGPAPDFDKVAPPPPPPMAPSLSLVNFPVSA